MNRKHTRKAKDHKKRWHPDDVEIGRQKWIRFIEDDWNAVEKYDVDELLASTEVFWRALEVNCVSECCGISAHSFLENDTWEAARRCKAADLTEKLIEIREAVSSVPEEVVTSSILNQLLDRLMFLDLLGHTVECVKRMKVRAS